MSIDFPQPVLSPCIGICQLGDDQLCVGCLRSADEIGRWLSMDGAERRHIMEVVLVRREGERS